MKHILSYPYYIISIIVVWHIAPLSSRYHNSLNNKGTNKDSTIIIQEQPVYDPSSYRSHHNKMFHNITIIAPSVNIHDLPQSQFSTTDWQKYLKHIGCTTAHEILKDPLRYQYLPFLLLAKQLPEYHSYVEHFYHQYKSYSWLHKKWLYLWGNYPIDLEKHFQQLDQESTIIEQNRLQAERCAQERITLCNQYINMTESFHRDYNCLPQDAYQGRLKALNSIKNGNNTRTTRPYDIPEAIDLFASDHEIDLHRFIHGSYNEYEYALNNEFIHQIGLLAAAEQMAIYKLDDTMIDMVTEGVHIGLEANSRYNTQAATILANYGWRALNIIKSVKDGVILGTSRIAHMIRHPIDTATEMIVGIGQIGLLAQKAAVTIMHVEYLWERGEEEDIINYYKELHQYAAIIGHEIQQSYAKTSTDDLIKYCTAFGVEALLTHKLTQWMSKCASYLSRAAPEANALLYAEYAPCKTALTTEECIQESILLNEATHNADNIKPLITRKMHIEAAKEIERKFYHLYQPYKVDLESEIILLKKEFEGTCHAFGIDNKKYIKFPYEHTFGIDLCLNKKGNFSINGFHHDYMNYCEKNNIVEFINKIMYENGFYKADIKIGSNIIHGKTFFPAEWPREKVMQCIKDTYIDFIQSGKTPILENEKYMINIKRLNNINIEMYITKNFNITTAYPVLKK